MFHKRLIKEFKCNRKYVAGIVITQWIAMIANILLLGVMAAYINRLASGQAATGGQTVVSLFLWLAGAVLLRSVMTLLSGKMSFEAAKNVKIRLRERTYEKLMALGISYKKTTTTAEAVQISTEGVEQLEIYFGKYMPQFFYSLLAPATLFFIVGSISIKAASVLLLCVPIIPISIIAVQKFAKKLLNKHWGAYTNLGDSFLENLQGLSTLKIYQADAKYAKKMDEEAENFRKSTMRVLMMQLNSISIMDLVAFGGAAAGILISVLELKKGVIGLGQCFFVIMAAAEFFIPLRQLGSFFHIAMNGNAAADKIFKLLDEAKENAEGDVKIHSLDNGIQFSQVAFSYENGDKEQGYMPKRVLKQVTFKAAKHGLTALVGASGSGKSTIADLIMGEYRGDEGSVLLGEQSVSSIDRAELRRKITRVRHNSYLFKGTIEENLRMGNEQATNAEIEAVLKQVNLLDTVMEKGGVKAMLTEQADNFSGGQRQRLALARAILHDSDIYIFDEATSNIDADSENKIMEIIYELAKRKTVLLISHRLLNVADAEAILVLYEGSIVEQGTHADLVKKKGFYHKLYERQAELEKFQKEAG